MTDTAQSDPAQPDIDAAETEAPDAAPELHGCVLVESCGQLVVHPRGDQYLDLVKALDDDGYTMCVDLTGVDYLEHMGRPLPEGIVAERFEVVVNLLDLHARRRVRLRVQVPESTPTLPSLFDLYPGSEAMERETFDMFGISFDGHPDLTRILMPEDWVGHPLRKDYDVGAIPVQFKGANA
jgi:NADH-quinone oxidoreductase subunit C